MGDQDLSFLFQCSNDQLQLLADFILYDEDGKSRSFEHLSSTEYFKEYYPGNMALLIPDIIPDIINELRRLGANTGLSLTLESRVGYREILGGICKHFKIIYNKHSSIESIEYSFLQQILLMSVDQMDEEDIYNLSGRLTREMFRREIRIARIDSIMFVKVATVLVAGLAAKYKLTKSAGLVEKFSEGKVFTILTSSINRIFSEGLNTLAITYHALLPCVIVIAYLRSLINSEKI